MFRNILIALAIISTVTAHAEIKPYISLGGGGTFLKTDFRDGTSSETQAGAIGEVAVGFRYREDVIASPVRTELAFSSQNNNFIDADMSIMTFMANGYVDISTETALTPYFLVGVGMVQIDIDSDYGSDDDNAFAYQFGGGIGYSLTEKIILDCKYKYFMTEDYEFLGDNIRHSDHQVQLSVRYQF